MPGVVRFCERWLGCSTYPLGLPRGMTAAAPKGPRLQSGAGP